MASCVVIPFPQSLPSLSLSNLFNRGVYWKKKVRGHGHTPTPTSIDMDPRLRSNTMDGSTNLDILQTFRLPIPSSHNPRTIPPILPLHPTTNHLPTGLRNSRSRSRHPTSHRHEHQARLHLPRPTPELGPSLGTSPPDLTHLPR